MFFKEEQLSELVKRRKGDVVGRQLFCDLMSDAEWCFKQPVPVQPHCGPGAAHKEILPLPGETPFRADYLLVHGYFEALTFAFERSVLQMSFVYRLTNDTKWVERTCCWLEEAMNEWKYWGPKGYQLDQFAVRIMYATALSLHWVGNFATEKLTHQCRVKVEEYARKCVETWGKSLEVNEPGQFQNHYWFNISMLAVTAKWLGEYDKEWGDTAEKCFRKLQNLTEWAIGPDGDYLDKENFLLYSFRFALIAFELWYRDGGPNVFTTERMIAATRWLCDMVCPGDYNLLSYPETISYRWIFMLLASHQKNSTSQWLGLKQTNRMGHLINSAMSEWINMGSLWSYLFYDETVGTALPDQNQYTLVRAYKWSGWTCMGATLSENKPKVALYAGPTSGKNYYNQGELYVSAYGERLLETPQLPVYGYISAHKCCALQMSNLSGAVLTVNGLGQAGGTYPDEWPGLSQIGHPVRPPLCKTINVIENSGECFVSADLTLAYRDFSIEGMWGCKITVPPQWQNIKLDRLKKYIRSVQLKDGNIIILEDEIQSHTGDTIDLEWHFGTHANITIDKQGKVILEKGRALMNISLLSSDDVGFSVIPAHYSEDGKFLTLKKDKFSGTINLRLMMEISKK